MLSPYYIIVTILLLVIITWIYIRFDTKIISNDTNKKQSVIDTIQWLYRSVNDICYHCNMSPIYEIKETCDITYTDKVTSSHNIKGTIHLVVWNNLHNRIYSHNTLMYAILHEIAHILSPSIHHEPPFDSIESILLNTAIQLGYYDPNISIDPSYMTLDLTSV